MKFAICTLVLVCVSSGVNAEERRPSLISPEATARLEREMGQWPRTVAEKRQAALKQANRQHLFGMGKTVSSQASVPAAADETKPTRFSAAFKNFREASAELFELTCRFVVESRAFFLLGIVAVIGVFRAVSSRIAVARKRRELRGLLGTTK